MNGRWCKNCREPIEKCECGNGYLSCTPESDGWPDASKAQCDAETFLCDYVCTKDFDSIKDLQWDSAEVIDVMAKFLEANRQDQRQERIKS